MTELLPKDTGFFSWGDGTWGEVHRFTTYDERGDFYANGLCEVRFKVNHVAARTAEDWAASPCQRCADALFPASETHRTTEGK